MRPPEHRPGGGVAAEATIPTNSGMPPPNVKKPAFSRAASLIH